MSENAEIPAWFAERLAQQYAREDVERILEGCAASRRVSLRANTLRSDRGAVARALDEAGVMYDPVPWYSDAFVVRDARERAIWDLPAYREGELYLQSLSSMIPALVLDVCAGHDVCDMCAAPGGKTTQIVALAQGKAFVTACEMHAPRAEKLEFNLQKLGARNVTVLRMDARRMDDFFSFDRILVDAPCSGSGTLRAGDAKAARRFTPALLEKSLKAQRALLTRGLGMMKPGSVLVYSTCSVLKDENEEIVTQALRQMRRKGTFELEPIERDGFDVLPTLPSAIDGALTLCPTDLYEGFFVAKVKRTA